MRGLFHFCPGIRCPAHKPSGDACHDATSDRPRRRRDGVQNGFRALRDEVPIDVHQSRPSRDRMLSSKTNNGAGHPTPAVLAACARSRHRYFWRKCYGNPINTPARVSVPTTSRMGYQAITGDGQHPCDGAGFGQRRCRNSLVENR